MTDKFQWFKIKTGAKGLVLKIHPKNDEPMVDILLSFKNAKVLSKALKSCSQMRKVDK